MYELGGCLRALKLHHCPSLLEPKYVTQCEFDRGENTNHVSAVADWYYRSHGLVNHNVCPHSSTATDESFRDHSGGAITLSACFLPSLCSVVTSRDGGCMRCAPHIRCRLPDCNTAIVLCRTTTTDAICFTTRMTKRSVQ